MGLDGTHRIGRFFVVGAEFDDESHTVPHVVHVFSDTTHFRSEGGAGVDERGEGTGDVLVVGGEAGVHAFLVLHNRRL